MTGRINLNGLKNSRWIKLILINLAILGALIIIIELIWGGWFLNSNRVMNLGIPINVNWEIKQNVYPSEDSIVLYRRDRYGLRGLKSFNHPERIEILTIGGSTTDQRLIGEGKTWQDLLSNKLNIIVANAGIDGQSTIGHINNFKWWLSKINGLNPSIIIYYIGINDYNIYGKSFVIDHSVLVRTNNPLFVAIKENSIIFNTYRKIKGAIESRVNKSNHQKISNKNNSFSQALVDSNTLLDYRRYADSIYKPRVVELIRLSKMHFPNSKLLFVSQPMSTFYINESDKVYGSSQGVLMRMLDKHLQELHNPNDSIYYFDLCKKQNYINFNHYYDNAHMTESGAKWVAHQLFQFIKQSGLSK